MDKILKNLVLLWYNYSINMVKKYYSKNASSADNQQERSEIKGWIVGFTDGEGCFSVSIIKNKTTKLRKRLKK